MSLLLNQLRFRNALLPLLLLGLASLPPALAQAPAAGLPAPRPEFVHVRPDQMPELPGGGGQAAVLAALVRQVEYPADARRYGVEGTSPVAFTVRADGSVTDAVVPFGLGHGCDQALLAAVRRLPRFTPGRHRGQAVTVRVSYWVRFELDGRILPGTTPQDPFAVETSRPEPPQPRFVPADTSRVYAHAERMPTLPDGNGLYALDTWVQRGLTLPPEVREGRLEGRVFVAFTIGTSGAVRDVKVVKPLSAAADAAACRAVAAVRFRPATQGGQPVAVRQTVPVAFFGPRHVYGKAPGQNPKAAVSDFDAYFDQHMQVPTELAGKQGRRMQVAFVVLPDGRTDSAQVVFPRPPNDCPTCDVEALRLVRGLPRYEPGRNERGEPIAVAQQVDIRMPPARTDSTGIVYTYVEQMPTLPGETGGTAAISAAVQRNLVLPAGLPAGTQRVFVTFDVGPSGFVMPKSIKVMKSLSPAADAAAVAAVAKLPRLQGGRQNGRPVSVNLTLPVVFAKP